MPNNIAKDRKLVVTVLLGLSILVLGSFIIDRNIGDILYFAFLMSCLIRYFLLIKK